MRHTLRLLLVGLAALTLPVWAANPPPAASPPPPQVPEPTEAEIQTLYRERIEWINQGSTKFLGEQGAAKVLIRFDALKKTECQSTDKGVYECRVFVDSAFGKGHSETRRLTLTLVRDGDDWRLK